jgi:hypothetical protein
MFFGYLLKKIILKTGTIIDKEKEVEGRGKKFDEKEFQQKRIKDYVADKKC